MKTPILSELLTSYETFIFDADGVLWLGGKVILGSPEFVNFVINEGKQVLIISNGTTLTIDGFVKKSQKMGYNINEENVVTASVVTAFELEKEVGKELPVYVIGSLALQETLESAGFKCFGAGPVPIDENSEENLANLCSIKISAVITSIDKHFNYFKIMKAVNYLKDQNIKFIATNEDLSDPGPIPGLIYPAAGCMSNCIANMSGRKPTVMGKPNTATFEYILTKIGIDPKKTLMIGDRGDTDMMFGNVHGMDTMLALSGICQLDDVEKFKKEGKKDFIPKYWVSSIGELLKHEKNSIEQGF